MQFQSKKCILAVRLYNLNESVLHGLMINFEREIIKTVLKVFFQLVLLISWMVTLSSCLSPYGDKGSKSERVLIGSPLNRTYTNNLTATDKDRTLRHARILTGRASLWCHHTYVIWSRKLKPPNIALSIVYYPSLANNRHIAVTSDRKTNFCERDRETEHLKSIQELKPWSHQGFGYIWLHDMKHSLQS